MSEQIFFKVVEYPNIHKAYPNQNQQFTCVVYFPWQPSQSEGETSFDFSAISTLIQM
jgi:hypothetical protein